MHSSIGKCYRLYEQPLVKLTEISDYLVSSFRGLSYFKLEIEFVVLVNTEKYFASCEL